MMKILAFDTSGKTMSVAVLDNNKILANQDIFQTNCHSELLVPTIEKCLNQAQIWYQDLDLLAITSGIGSITGIRIGFCAAKAIKLAFDLPLIEVSSLQIIAHNYINCFPKNQNDFDSEFKYIKAADLGRLAYKIYIDGQ